LSSIFTVGEKADLVGLSSLQRCNLGDAHLAITQHSPAKLRRDFG